jgi:hypothetical protein
MKKKARPRTIKNILFQSISSFLDVLAKPGRLAPTGMFLISSAMAAYSFHILHRCGSSATMLRVIYVKYFFVYFSADALGS